jgi:hypothetical protein
MLSRGLHHHTNTSDGIIRAALVACKTMGSTLSCRPVISCSSTVPPLIRLHMGIEQDCDIPATSRLRFEVHAGHCKGVAYPDRSIRQE